jgi:thiaminase (transcriptional activator TenA)
MLSFHIHSVQRPPVFDAWIDMYGGEEFAKEVCDYRAMVDVACSTADADEFNRMREHFLMCCRLEHMFWDQAMQCMEWPLFGDGAVTNHSTSS